MEKNKKSFTIKDDERYFGQFKCSKCKRAWMSANSWKGMGQKCEKCNIYVFPWELNQLRRPDAPADSKNTHPQELCMKCKSLGRLCTTYY